MSWCSIEKNIISARISVENIFISNNTDARPLVVMGNMLVSFFFFFFAFYLRTQMQSVLILNFTMSIIIVAVVLVLKYTGKVWKNLQELNFKQSADDVK